jgi:hypothetical protein
VRLYEALLAIAWPRRLPWEIPPANHGNGAFGLPDACLDDDPDAWLDEMDLD